MSKVPSDSQFAIPDTISHQWRKRSVVVNRTAGTVEFRHCHVLRANLIFPKSQPYFTCPIPDLRAVHFTPRFKNNSAFLTIVTTTGKATVPDKGTHFAELRLWLAEAVPINDTAFATDNPQILLIYVLFGTACLFTAAFLTERAGNGAMIVAGFLGAIFGIGATRLLVYIGSRLLRTDITYPIVSIIGGVIISAALTRYVEWKTALAVGTLLTATSYYFTFRAKRWPRRQTHS